jgi:DNA-binding transcriptional MerR regulator
MMKTMTTPINRIQIPDRLYFRIGDVAELIGVKPYVLRYWESEFPMISPQKSSSGQRVYRRSDVETVLMIKHLLYEERYSVEGAKKRIRELRKEGELKLFKEETVAASVEEACEGLPAAADSGVLEQIEVVDALVEVETASVAQIDERKSSEPYTPPTEEVLQAIRELAEVKDREETLVASLQASQAKMSAFTVSREQLRAVAVELRTLTQVKISDLFSS